MEKIKKLVGISSFCDNEEKIKVLKSNLLKLKDLGVDTLLFTPLPLPQEVYNLCTEVILSSENPILKWPERGMLFWESLKYNSDKIKCTTIKEDYGWSSLNQLKRLSQYASNLDYDIFHLMIYDLDINPEIESEIKSNVKTTLYPVLSPTTNRIRKVGCIFSTFDKSSLKLFGESLNKSSYLNFPSAEEYLQNINKTTYNFSISSIVTKDVITYDKDLLKTLANFSHSSDLKLFINNRDYLGIYFHGVTSFCDVNIKINNSISSKIIDDNSYFISSIPLKEINSLEIEINNSSSDYSHYLPNNTLTLYEFKVNDKRDLNSVKDFVYSNNLQF